MDEGKALGWNDRVVPPEQRVFLRRVQTAAACRLAGGAVLSGVHLIHRLSRDLDLFCDERESVRDVLAAVRETAEEMRASVRIARDGGTFVLSQCVSASVWNCGTSVRGLIVARILRAHVHSILERPPSRKLGNERFCRAIVSAIASDSRSVGRDVGGTRQRPPTQVNPAAV